MAGMKWIRKDPTQVVPQHTQNKLFYIEGVSNIRRDEKYEVQVAVQEDNRAIYYESIAFFDTIKECKDFVKSYYKHMKKEAD